MKALRIGHVDLDTSHPQGWIPIERELGHTVVGVYDGGTVYPEGYAAEFASKLDIPNVFTDLEAMAEAVDVAIIHSCNWDLHVERARPFIEADKAVLIDKPMAGNVQDANQLIEWKRRGHRICGGSSLYFCDEVVDFLAEPVDKRGTPTFVYVGCGVDEFNYGSHAYAMGHALLGPGAQSVRYMGSHGQRQIEAVWKDGRCLILVVGEAAAYLPFYATVVSERSVRHIVAQNRTLYKALLSRVLPYLGGEAEELVPLETLLEAERVAIAARYSWTHGGISVDLNDIPLDDPGYNGATFAAGYRLSKIKK
jgi:hypothetical protein